MKNLLSVVLVLLILCVSTIVLAENPIPDLSGIAVGDVITFGHYEQDNNLDNGPEAIEWIVLDVQDGKALLLSKYALDTKPYNTEFDDITWEQCTLRTWLNNDFLMTAFNETEQSVILTTYVDNSSAQGHSAWSSISGGNNTEDRISLLSFYECGLYFPDYDTKMCALTAYAVSNGAYASIHQLDGKAVGWWWLRSPGDDQHNAAYVKQDGSRACRSVDDNLVAVRPAFWINLISE